MRYDHIGSAGAAQVAAIIIGCLLVVGSLVCVRAQGNSPPFQACPNDSGITLPPGFCATVFADNIGHARHLVVAI